MGLYLVNPITRFLGNAIHLINGVEISDQPTHRHKGKNAFEAQNLKFDIPFGGGNLALNHFLIAKSLKQISSQVYEPFQAPL